MRPTAGGLPRTFSAGYRQGWDTSTGFRQAQPASSPVSAVLAQAVQAWRKKPPDAESAPAPRSWRGWGRFPKSAAERPHGLPRCFFGVRCTRCQPVFDLQRHLIFDLLFSFLQIRFYQLTKFITRSFFFMNVSVITYLLKENNSIKILRAPGGVGLPRASHLPAACV